MGTETATNQAQSASDTGGLGGDGSLGDKIRTRVASFNESADDDTKRIYAEGIDAVARSGVLERAIGEGDTAPGFTLPNATGESVELSSLLARGPVVLVWYRGGWCPYCNLTLAEYQRRLSDIRDAGATLVAISPEKPDNALSTKEKNELEFEVLTDENNRVAREYGVVFDLTEPVHHIYNDKFGFDAWNGQDSGELPLSATYVIRPDGTVAYAFLDKDYRERAEPVEVITALKDVGGA